MAKNKSNLLLDAGVIQGESRSTWTRSSRHAQVSSPASRPAGAGATQLCPANGELYADMNFCFNRKIHVKNGQRRSTSYKMKMEVIYMRRWFATVLFLLLIPGLNIQVWPQTKSSDWKADLEQRLHAQYVLSKTSKLFKERVTEPGTVVVVKAEGITTGMTTKIVTGKVVPPAGLAQAMLPAVDKHNVKIGERFYITDIDVHDENVKFVLLSTDSSDVTRGGTSTEKHWLLPLEFEYPRGRLREIDFSKVLADIGAIIPTEAAANAVQTKTIEAGQSTAQVEAVMGKPETIVNLSGKTIYTYKNMKITFIDGKVSDVQ